MESDYTVYGIHTLEIAMTRNNGLMACFHEDLLAHIRFDEISTRIGQETSTSWRGENGYHTDNNYEDFLVLPENVEATRGSIEFLGKGWLKGTVGIPGHGVARFLAREKRGKDAQAMTGKMIGVRYWERYWRWTEDMDEHGEKVGCIHEHRFFPDRWGDMHKEVEGAETSEEEES